MSEHLQKAIAELEAKLAEQLKAAAKTKSGINQLADLAGLPVPYPETEERSGGAMRPDQFYGKALHTAMREYLELRGKPRGPATVNEIHDALVAGGYLFDTKNEENSKRVIRITLTKNSIVFHKLPNGSYGLLAWYPNVKATKATKKAEEPDAQHDNAGSPLDAQEEGEEPNADDLI